MNIFKNLLKHSETMPNPPAPRPVANNAPAASSKAKKYKVAGVTHYEKSILKFAQPNPLYSKSAKEIIAAKQYNTNIYQYCFAAQATQLIPEPSNPHDPNAIKVIIGGEHVGYIKAGSCKHILNLIAENRIERIDSVIKGGKFINVWYDGSDQKIEKGNTNFGIEVLIMER